MAISPSDMDALLVGLCWFQIAELGARPGRIA
jgi:hypothetical protein